MNVTKKEILVKNLKKEILLPMSEEIILNLKAVYVHTIPGVFSGSLKFDKEVFFTSDVIDGGSNTPNQIIKGYFSNLERMTQLAFLKAPRVSFLAGLYYLLEKKCDDNLCGTYMGKWYALPYNFQSGLNNISIEQMENFKKEIHFLNISGKAEITISEN
jgi:hypothetical protein